MDDRTRIRAVGRPSRLQSVDVDQELTPWKRAHELTRCALYWAPVTGFPAPAGQKQWFLAFLDRFLGTAKQKLSLRAEVFLQYKVVYPDLRDTLAEQANDLLPMIGLSRRPGAPLAPMPNESDFDGVLKGQERFDMSKHCADYCYWLLGKDEKKEFELFFGHGGITVMLLPPDPETVPPKLPLSQTHKTNPMFGGFDLDRLMSQAFSLKDGFQARSKAMFGAGWEKEPQARHIRFVLPLLTANDFFVQSKEEVEKWFQLGQIWIQESLVDNGVLLASSVDLDSQIIEILRSMKEQGITYPVR